MAANDSYSLKDKTALVGGSTQGIGLATAHRLAELGATCVLIARNEATLGSIVPELPHPFGQEHGYLVADYSKPTEVKACIQSAVANGQFFDIVINNTGGPPHGAITEADPQAFIKAIEMHVVCNQIILQAVLPQMKANKYGRFINIISTSVREPIPGLGVSNTTRWAVAAWAKTTSREVAPFGITMNNVLPGFTDTARLQSLFDSKSKASGRDVKDVADEAIARIPAGRLGKPEEIAAAVAFLASPAAAYINGINLPVDGGRLASM